VTTSLFILGLVCVLAAVTGSGFKAFGIEVPAIGTPRRQVLLAAIGMILMVAAGIATRGLDDEAASEETGPATLEERDAYWDVSSGLRAYDARRYAAWTSSAPPTRDMPRASTGPA
jgi:hypothetical protein